MAISDKPWSNFSPSDYDNAQWKRACLIHMDANSDAKADHPKRSLRHHIHGAVDVPELGERLIRRFPRGYGKWPRHRV